MTKSKIFKTFLSTLKWLRRDTMLEDTLLENSELKKKIEKLEDKIRNQEDKIKSLEEKKDKYKKEAAAAKGLKIREG